MSHSRCKRPLAAWLWLLGLCAFVGLLFTEVASYSNNTLRAHPDWVSGKLLLSSPTMRSASTLFTRNLLARNHLNLEVWHAHNEILYSQSIRPRSITLKARLAEDAYFYLLFNKDREGFSAVRLSRDDRFPGMFLRAAHPARFGETQPLPPFELGGGWFDLRLDLVDGEAALSIDGRLLASSPIGARGEGFVGVRSGRHPVWIDDVVIQGSDGERIVDENFRNDDGYLAFFAATWMALFALTALVRAVVRVRGGDGRRALFGLTTAMGCTAIVLGISLGFDRLYWSRIYPFETTPRWWEMNLRKRQLLVEDVREFCFSSLPWLAGDSREAVHARHRELRDLFGIDRDWPGKQDDLILIRGASGDPEIEPLESETGAIREYLARRPVDEAIRILVLGTSQTWGEGAVYPHERMAVRLWDRLALNAGLDRELVVANASKRGSRSRLLLERYRDHLHLLQPHLVLVNLSNNDSRFSFRENLLELVAFARHSGAEVVFSLEPNSLEHSFSRGQRTIMSKVAAEQDVTLVDLHGFIASAGVYDSGILFRDLVHMTSYGQRRAADRLAETIVPQLRSLAASSCAE